MQTLVLFVTFSSTVFMSSSDTATPPPVYGFDPKQCMKMAEPLPKTHFLLYPISSE